MPRDAIDIVDRFVAAVRPRPAFIAAAPEFHMHGCCRRGAPAMHTAALRALLQWIESSSRA